MPTKGQDNMKKNYRVWQKEDGKRNDGALYLKLVSFATRAWMMIRREGGKEGRRLLVNSVW